MVSIITPTEELHTFNRNDIHIQRAQAQPTSYHPTSLPHANGSIYSLTSIRPPFSSSRGLSSLSRAFLIGSLSPCSNIFMEMNLTLLLTSFFPYTSTINLLHHLLSFFITKNLDVVLSTMMMMLERAIESTELVL